MAERYKVRVTKDHLVFCAGHFISYEGDKCERLHGHNYRAAVEVEGPLDAANHYVFDFIALKHRTKAITDELDHHMLLPTRNPVVHLEERAGSVRVISEALSMRDAVAQLNHGYERPIADLIDGDGAPER